MLRPYIAVLASHFQLMLQYRAAAIAGFATQCWWGAIKIMVFAAYFASGAGPQPMSLANAVTYIWLGQALLVLLPWGGDPEVAEMVRSGAVSYERLRPVDTHTFWFCRALSSMVARVLPRAALMVLTAGVFMPLVGLGKWGLPPPAGLAAGAWFGLSILSTLLLSSAIRVLLTIVVVASLTDRGVNTLATPMINIFSGSIIPIAFYPDWLVPFMRLQPLAGLADTPFRIYFGEVTGLDAAVAIALQLFWAATLVVLGRIWLGRTMQTLQVQGG